MYLFACLTCVVILSFLALSSGPFSELLSSLHSSSPKVPYSVAVGSLRETISPMSTGLLPRLSDRGPVYAKVSLLAPLPAGMDAPLFGLLEENFSASSLKEYLRSSLSG